MPTISYRVNPSNGIKYAYSVTSYWDKEKKAPRTKRTYLGRVDPDSGEIIPPSSGKGRMIDDQGIIGEDGFIAPKEDGDIKGSSMQSPIYPFGTCRKKYGYLP